MLHNSNTIKRRWQFFGVLFFLLAGCTSTKTAPPQRPVSGDLHHQAAVLDGIVSDAQDIFTTPLATNMPAIAQRIIVEAGTAKEDGSKAQKYIDDQYLDGAAKDRIIANMQREKDEHKNDWFGERTHRLWAWFIGIIAAVVIGLIVANVLTGGAVFRFILPILTKILQVALVHKE